MGKVECYCFNFSEPDEEVQIVPVLEHVNKIFIDVLSASCLFLSVLFTFINSVGNYFALLMVFIRAIFNCFESNPGLL